MDTSEARGSVAVLRDGVTLAMKCHQTQEDYSEWLLPAVDEALKQAGARLEELGLLAVATGPGSFTGLRVGLTTVKAWAEVYGKPVVAVSRLEAMARLLRADSRASFVAACYDAQRGQVFGALYHSVFERVARVEDEVVCFPAEFFEWVSLQAGAQPVQWISLDPELITDWAGWNRRAILGDTTSKCDGTLAPAIGQLGAVRAASGLFSDPLALDANYVRRSDAEIFWKRR